MGFFCTMLMISTLGYITWNVSPFIYEGEHFAIGWYGTLTTILALFYLLNLLYINKFEKLDVRVTLWIFIISLPLIEYCGHIVHGLFYEWYYSPDNPWCFLGIDWDYRNYYLDHPWKFLDLTHGGFASHGAYIGAIITAYLFEKIAKLDFMWLFDRLMICSNVMFITRLGNLLTSEIYGVSTTLPWGFLFNGESQPCHPTQIYEIFIFLSAYLVGYYLYLRRDGGRYRGLLTGSVFAIVFILRFLVEFIKNPQGEFEAGWALNMGQWLSIPFVIAGIYLIYKSIKQGKIFLPTQYAMNNEKSR